MASPEVVLSHDEIIAQQLEELPGYGPIRIATRVPDIPGVEYHKPLRGDEDQRHIAVIGYSALSVVPAEDGPAVEVNATGNDPVVLSPRQIEEVGIDHPHRRNMPLHGNSDMFTSFTPRDDRNVLRWPDHVIEYGWHDRFETGRHPDHPEVSMVTAYHAPIADENEWPVKIASLEEAKATATFPRVYMLSKITPERFVATVRFPDQQTREITVVHPRHPENAHLPELDVTMLDIPMNVSDEQMLELHLSRYEALRAQHPDMPKFEMSHMEADALFAYMTND